MLSLSNTQKQAALHELEDFINCFRSIVSPTNLQNVVIPVKQVDSGFEKSTDLRRDLLIHQTQAKGTLFSQTVKPQPLSIESLLQKFLSNIKEILKYFFYNCNSEAEQQELQMLEEQFYFLLNGLNIDDDYQVKSSPGEIFRMTSTIQSTYQKFYDAVSHSKVLCDQNQLPMNPNITSISGPRA